MNHCNLFQSCKNNHYKCHHLWQKNNLRSFHLQSNISANVRKNHTSLHRKKKNHLSNKLCPLHVQDLYQKRSFSRFSKFGKDKNNRHGVVLLDDDIDNLINVSIIEYDDLDTETLLRLKKKTFIFPYFN